jgi:hypothetical protein
VKNTVEHKATGLKLTRSQVGQFAWLGLISRGQFIAAVDRECAKRFPGFAKFEISATRGQWVFEDVMADFRPKR